MRDTGKRLALLKEAREMFGGTLDYWDAATADYTQSALEILVGRSSVLPK